MSRPSEENCKFENHCIHDCERNGEAAAICCWCGDLFLPGRYEHGEYHPVARERSYAG